MMTRVLIFFPLIIFNFNLLAQVVGPGQPGQSSSVVIPPPPNATSLGKYADYPLGPGTGTAGIDLPIYNFQCGSLTVPISLGYQSSGVKVENIASWVGTGWDLSAGGLITRTIRGKPDEALGGYNERGVALPTSINPIADYDYLEFVSKGDIDTQPDVFFFNFNGRSGKFYIDYEDNIILVPHQALKILEHPFDDNSQGAINKQQWVVQDEFGVEYTFGSVGANPNANNDIQGVEVMYYDQFGEVNLDHVSSWYLTKITSTHGDEINFVYGTKGTSYFSRQGETAYAITPGLDGQGKTVSESSYEVGGLSRLQEINARTGKVAFESNTARSDFTGDTRLDSIMIHNASDELLYTYAFTYEDVVYGSGPVPNIPSPENEAGRHRLFLTALQKKGMDLVAEPPHRFSYDRKDQMTHRYSYSQDHWGYYNGAANTTLIPDVVQSNTFTFPGITTFANREANTDYATRGLLKSIEYPTGGHVEFIYGSNRYSYSQQGYIDHYDMPVEIFGQAARNMGTGAPPTSQVIDFELSKSQTVNYSIDMERTTAIYTCDGGPHPEPPIEDETLGVVILDASNGEELSVPMNAYGCKAVDDQIYLAAGSYQMQLTTIDNSQSQKITARLFAEEEVDISTYCNEGECGSLLGGGIRVDTIKYFDASNTSPSLIKAFEYLRDINLSSGRMLGVPRYHRSFQYLMIDNNGPVSTCAAPSFTRTQFILSSSSQNQLGSFSGSSVYYSKVSEHWLDGNGTSNGKSENNYTYRKPTIVAGKIINDYGYRNGKPRVTTVFDNTDNALQRNAFSRSYDEFKDLMPKISGLFVETALSVGYTNAQGGTPPLCFTPDIKARVFTYQFFEHLTEFEIVKEATTEVTGQDGNTLSTVEGFHYDNFNHLQLSKSTMTGSDGKTYQTEYHYPQDYTYAVDSDLDKMVKSHLIATPIETIRFFDNEVISASATRYDPLDGFLPKHTYVYETSTPGLNFTKSSDGETFNSYQRKITILSRDDKGNILSQQPENNLITSYVWGYNSFLPIVQALGTDKQSLENNVASAINSLPAYSGGLADLDNLLDAVKGFTSESKINTWRDFNNALRNSLGAAHITTYTYDPLVGMTSQTDPNGITTFYEYDELNRLERIKDHEGNILEHYEYHYHDEGQGGAQ